MAIYPISFVSRRGRGMEGRFTFKRDSNKTSQYSLLALCINVVETRRLSRLGWIIAR